MMSILLWFVTHSVIKFLRKRNNEKEKKEKEITCSSQDFSPILGQTDGF